MHLSYFSAVAALVAAALWFWSASVPTPDRIAMVDGGFIDGSPKPIDDLDRLTIGLKRQSKLSGFAAIAAGIAAALQGVAFICPSCA